MKILRNILLPFISMLFMLTCRKPPKSEQVNNLKLQEEAFLDLTKHLSQRLAYMKDVAAYKWERELPIENLEREKIVLANSVEDAIAYDLDKEYAYDFFQLQIDLAKEIQSYWFNKWQVNGFNYLGYEDLNNVIRPQLIILGDSIVKKMAYLQYWEMPQDRISYFQEIFNNQLSIEGLSQSSRDSLFRHIVQVLPSSNKVPKL